MSDSSDPLAGRTPAVANNVDLGDSEIARAHEILRTEVGSGVHGMAIAGTDDHDETAIYVETPEQLLGLAPMAGHWTWRTRAMGERSGPGDIDLTSYALRRFVELCLAGNPTILIPLFATGNQIMNITELGQELRELVPKLLSLRAGHRFLGYLDAQLGRLRERGHRGSMPNRPELVAKFGYDTKYASHALRLGHQGLELLTTGRLTLPMPEGALAECRAVKTGEVGFSEAVAMIERNRTDLVRLVEARGGVLPEVPDQVAVDAWLVSAHRRHWDW